MALDSYIHNVFGLLYSYRYKYINMLFSFNLNKTLHADKNNFCFNMCFNQ